MENVLIVGATGATGKRIVDLLKVSHDYNPVAMVRKEEQREQFEKESINTVLADLEKDVSQAVEGIEKIIFAAGSKGENVTRVDEKGAEKIIDATTDKQIKKFVMLSSMGADDPEDHPQLKKYLVAKHAADAHLKESDLSYSIVRPGRLTNDEGTGKIKISEKLNVKGSISRDDVAATLVMALDDDIAKNKTFEILSGELTISNALKSIS